MSDKQEPDVTDPYAVIAALRAELAEKDKMILDYQREQMERDAAAECDVCGTNQYPRISKQVVWDPDYNKLDHKGAFVHLEYRKDGTPTGCFMKCGATRTRAAWSAYTKTAPALVDDAERVALDAKATG